MNNPIKFSELKNYNDSNSIVLTAILLEETDIPDVNQYFHEIKLLNDDKQISAIHHLSDNILGENGRSDFLIELTGEGIANPMIRIQLCMSGFGVHWTSDFIDNYARDYISSCE